MGSPSLAGSHPFGAERVCRLLPFLSLLRDEGAVKASVHGVLWWSRRHCKTAHSDVPGIVAIAADCPGMALRALGFQMYREPCRDVARDRVLVAPRDAPQSASSPLVSGAAVCSHVPDCPRQNRLHTWLPSSAPQGTSPPSLHLGHGPQRHAAGSESRL